MTRSSAARAVTGKVTHSSNRTSDSLDSPPSSAWHQPHWWLSQWRSGRCCGCQLKGAGGGAWCQLEQSGRQWPVAARPCTHTPPPGGPRFPNPVPYAVDEWNELLGSWTLGFSPPAEGSRSAAGSSGQRQRLMLALPHHWDTPCAHSELAWGRDLDMRGPDLDKGGPDLDMRGLIRPR